MESLDTTILNTAVPVVSQALEVAPLSMKSVGTVKANQYRPFSASNLAERVGDQGNRLKLRVTNERRAESVVIL